MDGTSSEAYEVALYAFLSIRLPLLILLSLSSFCLELLRSRFFRVNLRRHLVRNLMFAWMPLALAMGVYLSVRCNSMGISIWTYPLLAIWFFLFPNSVYLVTEVHHFRDKTVVPLWFDTIGILSYVYSGITLGSYSLLTVHCLLLRLVPTSVSWVVVVCYVFLASFGIYLGRHLRLYSWDVMFRPRKLVKRMRQTTLSQRRELFLSTLLYGLFILGCYISDVLTVQVIYSVERPQYRAELFINQDV